MSIFIHELIFFLLTFYTQILEEQQMFLGRAVNHISILIFKKNHWLNENAWKKAWKSSEFFMVQKHRNKIVAQSQIKNTKQLSTK